MNVLVTEDLYDRRFVESCTTGFENLRNLSCNILAEYAAPAYAA